ncbi:MAG TPA: ATP-binding protein [Sphingomicrobium sp.]|nr:ATP-binding protein [Sphingomicrobium sp.]
MAKGENELAIILAAFDEPLLIVRRGILLQANRAAQALFGRGIENVDVRLAIRSPKALSYILAGKAGDLEVSGIGGFGRPWLLSIREFDDGRLLVRLVDRSAAAAAEKMRVDFVANASHELRTPLAAILGYAETLADDENLDQETRLKFGQTIRGEARRMLRIIEDLMGLSRIEADRFVAPTESVAMEQIVASAVEQLRPAAASAGTEILIEQPDEVPAILGDRAQLTQMVDNLLNNAVRYGTNPSGVPIRVTIGQSDGSVRLAVEDSGQGIPQQHLPRLTERFYRVDAARSRDSGGTGLGLAIVKHIVERHRGTMEIRSKVGEGTSVVVTLPISRPIS